MQRTVRRTKPRGARCGCFSCLKIFGYDKIKAWADKGINPVCPHCLKDTVLETTPGLLITRELLQEMRSSLLFNPNL